jgi:hypothetical protein
MEIRFTPNPEDAEDGLRSAPRSTWGQFIYGLLLALLFFIGTYLIQNRHPLAGWAWLVVSCAIGIAMYEVPRRRARRAIRHNPSAQGEIVLTIDDRGIAARFATGNSQLEWRAFTRYRETNRMFLLFSGSERWTFVPKRVMSSEQVQEFRRLLRDHVRQDQTPSVGDVR